MFNYIVLKNYKSFKNIRIDLSKNNIPKKLFLLYGENGSGKSNFISAFRTLDEINNSIVSKELLSKMKNLLEENDVKHNDNFVEILTKEQFLAVGKIIKDVKTINSKENMYMEFGFNINGDDGHYIIETDNNSIIRESLYFKIDKSKRRHFDIKMQNSELNVQLSPSVFFNPKYKNDITNEIEKYWGKNSLVSILLDDFQRKNKEYISKCILENLIVSINELTGFSYMLKKGNRGEEGKLKCYNKVFENLSHGDLKSEEKDKLYQAEAAVFEIFTRLYSDIKSVFYKIDEINDKIEYTLYFRKMIGGELVDINYKKESTGTQKLLEIIPVFIQACNGETVLIDEFDTGIHDLLIKELLLNINESITGQLILTTHNTAIMESEIAKECVNFIVIDADGDKEVFSIDDYEHRTRHSHNIRKSYLNGIYEGVPIIRDIDFNEILDDLNNRV